MNLISDSKSFISTAPGELKRFNCRLETYLVVVDFLPGICEGPLRVSQPLGHLLTLLLRLFLLTLSVLQHDQPRLQLG